MVLIWCYCGNRSTASLQVMFLTATVTSVPVGTTLLVRLGHNDLLRKVKGLQSIESGPELLSNLTKSSITIA